MGSLESFWAVIPAGGAGTRLWPVSRAAAPKFLHDLTGNGRSLLQQTVDRLAPLVGDRLLVVTGEAHREAVLAELPHVDPGAVVAEPSARDSMAAIGLAAAMLERVDPEAVMGSFAADHVVTDTAAFEAAVSTAVEVARDGWLVTLGITPTHPATGFGYIHLGAELPGHPGACQVAAFVEKPAADVAERYLAGGQHRWNAGMFVVRPGVLLDLLAGQDPEFAARLREIAASPDLLGQLWDRLPRIALDHAVAEPAAAAGRVAVVPVDPGWDDIGDYDALAVLLGADDGGVRVLGDASLVDVDDATGLVVPGTGRTVAVVGLDDVVVVDTPDALLVTTRAHAQQVKDVVARLKAAGRTDLV
ncbi:mannose-1-phosphate guanylyltransferase [Nocardioides aestuarii]|uniref:Mannose-1-phosphate guanylyltransferase n=1 Tax=Nocardioides aestuarii TaxID=252231 RepID=A0ABW4TRC2_9ACTN